MSVDQSPTFNGDFGVEMLIDREWKLVILFRSRSTRMTKEKVISNFGATPLPEKPNGRCCLTGVRRVQVAGILTIVSGL